MRRLLVLVLGVALIFTGAEAVTPPKSEAACFTARCFNTQIRKLKRQVRTLRNTVSVLNGDVSALNTSVFGCERLAAVTQYFGYEYDAGGGTFLTTALDFTEFGDAVDNWVVVDICGPGARSASSTRRQADPPKSIREPQSKDSR